MTTNTETDMTTPTREEAEAAVRAAEERLTALRVEHLQVQARIGELKAELERLTTRANEILRPGWRGSEGEIPDTVRARQQARDVLSDLDAPVIVSDDGQRYVIVSAGPKQVKVRPAGKPLVSTDTLIRGARPRQYGRFRALAPADLEAAVAAFDAARKAKR